MTRAIQPADLGFFSALASAGSLSAAARRLLAQWKEAGWLHDD